MSEWITVAEFDSIGGSTAHRFDVVDSGGTSHRIAVVRIGDDLYAVGDRCSHADVSLAEGTVYDDECQLECIKHGSLFSLMTGAAVTLPATRPIPVFDVRREGNAVQVCVPGRIVESVTSGRDRDSQSFVGQHAGVQPGSEDVAQSQTDQGSN